jgi:myo-inositol-1(or 4)-monophosphatase
MTQPIVTPLMNVMVAAARKAARALIRDFGESEQLQASRKGPADFVSKADLKAERILRDELLKARPHYCMTLEEGGAIEGPDKSHRWYVDPLDGTTNFLHGIPHWAISIGLEREGHLVAGLVYNPLADEMYMAERGQGAWLNARRMRVSGRRDLKDALLATGIPFKGKPGQKRFAGELTKVMGEVSGVRRFGSAALDLAWVAAGRYDGYWERGLSSWDIAAGIVLIREAGGLVSDLAGGAQMLENGQILAANTGLHAPVLSLVGGQSDETQED